MPAPKFVRPNIRQMEGYTPGEQPAPGERVVKLNTNENPFPPSPKVMLAIQQIEPEQLRRYPNATAEAFRDAASGVLGVSSDMILAGNGSDDVLAIAMKTFHGLDLMHEAYVDFADANWLPLVKDYENVVLTRTLSKAYSLAGLRFGDAVARANVVAEMHKARDSYPCDAISVVAATAAILDQEYARKTWEHVKSERQRVSSELTQMGWKVLPSHANFILTAAPDGRGERAYLALKRQ